jgi:hypothetical protein
VQAADTAAAPHVDLDGPLTPYYPGELKSGREIIMTEGTDPLDGRRKDDEESGLWEEHETRGAEVSDRDGEEQELEARSALGGSAKRRGEPPVRKGPTRLLRRNPMTIHVHGLRLGKRRCLRTTRVTWIFDMDVPDASGSPTRKRLCIDSAQQNILWHRWRRLDART